MSKPFRDTQQGPVEKTSTGWGWYNYPATGSEIWQGDFQTRAAARKARQEQKASLKHTGLGMERAFKKS